jgi:UDP-N-acetylglucosamine enolpyruvyl transferase
VRLDGTIAVAGAKNAVTKQLVASLLTDQPCTLSNVPRLTEVAATLRMLEGLGTQYRWLSDDTLEVCTPKVLDYAVDSVHAGHNRIPLLVLSPLLHRVGRALVPQPGGCPIGSRPADFHLLALSRLGATITSSGAGYAARGRLRGATIRLPYPSVGATENSLLAAVLARGTTLIANAAVEPEVVDTVRFLRKMGARIAITPDRNLLVEGVTSAPIEELNLAVFGQLRLFEIVADVLLFDAVKHRRRELEPEQPSRPAQVRLEHLPDVHARGHTQRVEHDVHRRTIRQEGHVFLRDNLGDHALIAVAAGHLVPH